MGITLIYQIIPIQMICPTDTLVPSRQGLIQAAGGQQIMAPNPSRIW